MLKYFAEESKDATPIVPLKKSQLNQWLKKQPSSAVSWVEQTGFKAKPGDHCLVPDKKGKIDCVLVGIGPDAPYGISPACKQNCLSKPIFSTAS